MYQPIIRTGNAKTVDINTFGGLNRTDTIANEEFYDMKNIAPSYPYPAVRAGYSTIDCIDAAARIILSMEKEADVWYFTGIADAKGRSCFYYKNKCIPYKGNTNYSLTADSSVMMGEKIFIFPDKLYFDTTQSGAGLQDMGCKVTPSKIDFYGSKNTKTDVIINYLTASESGAWDGFSKGDSLIISGTGTGNDTVVVKQRGSAVSDSDIVSVVVEKISGRTLYVLCYNSAGKAVTLTRQSGVTGVTVEKYIPDMQYVCVHNNRLFGAGTDGRYIYASKLGDGCDFNSFAGLSTDSWWSEVATSDVFTGIVSYQNHVYAFKRHCFHEIYGDKPSNFKIPYLTKTGCTDGRSITELDGVLYFAGADGVYAYNGGAAKNIAVKLDIKVASAVGGADAENLYMRLNDKLYVYHVRRQMWYQYDDTPVYDIFCADGNLFFAEEGGISLQGGDNCNVCWSLVSKQYRAGFMKTNLINIWLLLSLGEGAQAHVSVSTDGGPFRLWDTVYADTVRSVRIPMRMNKCDTFQLKLEGVGDCMLHGIRFENRIGGKNTDRTGGMLSWQSK